MGLFPLRKLFTHVCKCGDLCANFNNSLGVGCVDVILIGADVRHRRTSAHSGIMYKKIIISSILCILSILKRGKIY